MGVDYYLNILITKTFILSILQTGSYTDNEHIKISHNGTAGVIDVMSVVGHLVVVSDSDGGETTGYRS